GELMRIAILVLLLVVGKVVCAQPFTMNGWQFHECNVPKLAEAVRKAPEYGVNFFIFSHERQRDVLHIGSLADQQKIPWYLWAHEFDDIPERFMVRNEIRPDDPRMSAAALSSSFRLGSRVNMDDPALLDYLRRRQKAQQETDHPQFLLRAAGDGLLRAGDCQAARRHHLHEQGRRRAHSGADYAPDGSRKELRHAARSGARAALASRSNLFVPLIEKHP